jgi:hypothetical protein
MHYGQVTFGVDERGEVGMLTRNIRIQASADAETSFSGGHVMAMAGSKMQAGCGVSIRPLCGTFFTTRNTQGISKPMERNSPASDLSIKRGGEGICETLLFSFWTDR